MKVEVTVTVYLEQSAVGYFLKRKPTSSPEYVQVKRIHIHPTHVILIGLVFFV